MAAFAPIADGDPIPDTITEEHSVHQILYWCGFTDNGPRNRIFNDSFGSYEDIKLLKPSDVEMLAKDFASRPAAQRVFFGVRRTKRLKAAVHFVADFYRVSLTPTIVGEDNESFKAALDIAMQRAEVRSKLEKQQDTAAKTASPGPLANERKWKEWETKFENYLSVIMGSNGVPLSYVIREDDAPPADVSTFTNFTTRSIACAPLTGVHYEADRYSVYQQILAFTTGQPSEDWIKGTRRRADGRVSMKALRDHFSGEGNA